MINISNTIKQACNSDKMTYREYVVLSGTTAQIDVVTEMYASAYKDTHFIGTFNMKYIKFTTSNDVQYRNKELTLYKEVNGESFKVGNFIVTEIKDNDSNEEVTVTAYDYGLKFAQPYQTSLNYEGGNVTLKDVLDEICTNVGIELVNTTITNGNFIVDSNQFVNGEMYGDVISAIAFISGDFATINENDQLEFIFTKQTNEIIEDYVDLEDKRDTRPITSLSIGTSQVQGQNAVIKDETLIEQYGEHWLEINDVPFAYTLEKREQLKQAIFDKVKGFGYSSFKSEYAFKPYYSLGDLIQFRNKDGQLVNSIILKFTSKYDNIILEAPSVTDATVEYENPKSAYDVAKRAEVIANQNTAEITYITTQTNQIRDDIANNYYTVEQTNQMIQNAETGVTNTFSEAGGNNVFRNTGLWFANSGEDAETNPYEFWLGKAKRGDNDNATNYKSILLQNGSFIQEPIVPNGNYSISFYYKKLIELANASVVINDKEYSLDSLEAKQFYTGEQDSETSEYIIDPIVVSNNHIKIEFKCDTNDGVEVYDLMCNKGAVKLAYSQNQNETTTSTVNISQGITITSSVDDVKFKADYDGIRILDGNNNPKTTFTDKGTETDELVVRKKATITGLLHQEVDDQTWVTKI